MKKIHVKVDTADRIIFIKYGRFGDWVQYSGGWFNAYSLQDVLDHFTRTELKMEAVPKLAHAR
jgi:hypothetical protein